MLNEIEFTGGQHLWVELDMLCPEVVQEFATLIAALEGGAEWMEMWN